MLLGSAYAKAARKYVGEIDPFYLDVITDRRYSVTQIVGKN